MRHLNSKKKLGLTSRTHRKAMLSNMAVSIIKHKKIKTDVKKIISFFFKNFFLRKKIHTDKTKRTVKKVNP